MASKRANGEGSIYKRADGRWCATISADHGRRKSFYGKTRQEVASKLAAALKAQQDGLPLAPERQTLAGFLAEWIEAVRPTLRPGSVVRYEVVLRRHVVPHIGRLPLAKLQPQHLQRLYGRLLDQGLSPTYVNQIHKVLHRALKDATRWGLTGRNVAGLVSGPRSRRIQQETLSPEEARALLDAAAGDRLEALYVLALTTGMRLGELLALKWEDVDLDASILRVHRTLQRVRGLGLVISEPKTPRSRRQIALPGVAVVALKRHKARQAEERLQLGQTWHDHGLVFPNEVGNPMAANNLRTRSFRRVLGRAGLDHRRFHSLRHTAATLLMGRGQHPKIVSEMLGHSQIATTMDLYSHVTPAMHRQAAAEMDVLLGSAQ